MAPESEALILRAFAQLLRVQRHAWATEHRLAQELDEQAYRIEKAVEIRKHRRDENA
jgi:hypothetical protein